MIVSLAALQSCEDVVDQIDENKKEQNAVLRYRGSYAGTYTGDVSGNLIINVSEKGTIKITRNNLNSSETYVTGFMLISNLNSKMGTWEMGSSKGNWTVKKN